jgi:riboflavin transporter FmnP
MHFLSSGLMIILLTSIRKRLHGFNGIVFSGVAGVVGVVLVMIPMNLWLASSFMGLEPTAFIREFLGVCVGFNVIKATANIVIYSVLSPAIIKEYNKLTHSD